MFSYIRYFSIISLVIVVVVAIFVGMYFQMRAAADLRTLVEKNNVALSQGFINTLWKKNTFRAHNIPVSDWNRYRNFTDFRNEVFRYFEGMPIVRLNIYTTKGQLLLSITQSHDRSGMTLGKEFTNLLSPGDDACRRPQAAIKSDQASSCLIPESTFRAPDGTPAEGALVRTLIPVLSDSYVPVVLDLNGKGATSTLKDGDVEAVIEIFNDVTPQWKQLSKFQMIGTGGIIGIFLILILLLLFTARRAENIIAKQHEVNIELAGQAATAQAENQQKSQFLANVSHELRTPLNAIIGFSEIIKNEVMGPLGNPQYGDYVRDIHSSGVHLLSLINDILDFSKAEAGKLELDISEVDATKIIKNCMRLVSPRAEQAQVQLIEEVPKEHFILKTDAKKLKQILLNLLSNAVKFTPAGGSVTVTAWYNVAGDSLSIEVKDTGIGIAPKDISRAMAPFGQVDNALSRKYEGTGLGLPLTRKFVEIMGGTFNIASELNVGTTVTFNIPIDAEKAKKKGA